MTEIIRETGIFIIVAEAMVCLAPSEVYKKYIRLIVGMVLVVQMTLPVLSLFSYRWEAERSCAKTDGKGDYAETWAAGRGTDPGYRVEGKRRRKHVSSCRTGSTGKRWPVGRKQHDRGKGRVAAAEKAVYCGKAADGYVGYGG